MIGLALFLRDRTPESGLRFDWTGFIVLAIGLGALQLMLDRGAHKDWFESTEIVIYAVIAGLGCYLFLVHIWLSPNPLLPPGIFREPQFQHRSGDDVLDWRRAGRERRDPRALPSGHGGLHSLGNGAAACARAAPASCLRCSSPGASSTSMIRAS